METHGNPQLVPIHVKYRSVQSEQKQVYPEILGFAGFGGFYGDFSSICWLPFSGIG